METSRSIEFLLLMLSYQLPIIVGAMVGVMVALIFFYRNPLPAGLVLVACLGLLTAAFGGPITTYVLRFVVEIETPILHRLFVYFWQSVKAVSICMLVAAAFLGRGARKSGAAPQVNPSQFPPAS